MSYLVKAIRSLKPNSEFAFQDDDYSTIEWHVLEGKAPSQSEIDAKIAEIEAAEEATEQNRIAAREALLTRLGITENEAKLLLA